MKIKLTLWGLLVTGTVACAQQKDIKDIAAVNPPDVALGTLKYLASDELKGRNIERPEIDTAAQYIADQFKVAGAKPLKGAEGYFQLFDLKMITPSKSGTITLGTTTFKTGVDAAQVNALDVNVNAPVAYGGKGSKEELAPLDVKGKVVLLDMGKVDQSNMSKLYREVADLQKMLKDKGAAALVEQWDAAPGFWNEMSGYLSGSKPVEEAQAHLLPAILINSTALDDAITKPGITAGIAITGTKTRTLALKNVMAYIPGTDAALRGQYLLLSSHYDHLGVTSSPKQEDGKLDSIYNGARDNASGTAAIIAAARYFGKHPAKRSILFIAYTAEEEGLLGSAYYAAHPVLPLKQTVYNLNIDNASYNDTTLISLVGIGRTSADPLIKKACAAYGLRVGGDPTGGQLFSGSDNYPLAGKGIPAPTYSLGMKTFDETITNRYHQLSDEFDNMDKNYVMKFFESYTLAAKYIADEPGQPTWTANDEYEKAWKALFGK
ncbi:M28 family metallopeptidase [Mucilaginibacter sp. L3T2-6]|uniref:M28 family metallopeptidase n=1 Tax=Mucilaginibacter sp. L3T2-6 TaxID=3062491 RepID=UPI002674DE1A|nr:M28 family peptidase [Mucilaginibacter sp. L3T2-6]MDO3641922.1 M28 family peptidase [Mucilaginibacter sp. L3T2-6]MDV6214400.1 M28 family peptidase [Mucilaginibacter sp. L3T2-6]